MSPQTLTVDYRLEIFALRLLISLAASHFHLYPVHIAPSSTATEKQAFPTKNSLGRSGDAFDHAAIKQLSTGPGEH